MKPFVIDFGMGNLGSVCRALEECGAPVVPGNDPALAASASHLILPGVGSFAEGMARLNALGWPEVIRKLAVDQGVPVLGICLGMQLLATSGTEGGFCPGLGLVPGHVVRLNPQNPSTRIPHVGWNEVWPVASSDLLNDVLPGTDFYFVHSYHFQVEHKEHVLAKTPYCGGFSSVVGNGLVFGTQFHPEKSYPDGFKILRNFLGVG